jgi:phage tail sheath protein FI
MNIYRTPGVYIEEVQTIPPAVAAVATAVPAFLGYTADATHAEEAIRITSLLEFEQFFGGSPVTRIDLDITKRTTEGGALLGVDVALAGSNPAEPVPVELLHYAVKHYFANGGGPCWIYSLGAHGSNTTGDYTDGIAALEAIDEPTLLVFPGATRLTNPGDHESVVQAALESCLRTQDRFTIADVRDAMPGGAYDTITEIDAASGFRSSISPTDPKALQYGAAYWPYLQTRIPWFTNDANVFITSYVEEQLMNNGTTTTPVTPLTTAVGGAAVAVSDTLVRDDETAVYNAARGFAAAQYIVLPPSAAVAGAYATTDRNRGVWKAPANVGLAMVSGPMIAATNDINDALNVDPTSGKSVNVIRSFTGRGIKIWGARTLAGNDNEFRYVPVRRLTIMIEESIEKAIASFVFESNDANTWVKVRTMIENFLLVQWRAGALQGEKPKHAFDVQVGLGQTMTADDILNGYLRVRVAIAPVRPAEFIVLTFEQKLPSS